MGSKIPRALIQGLGGITALQYEALSTSPQPYCDSHVCNAEISFVKRHLRKCADQTIEVLPCYRLKKSSEHHQNCKYNLKGALSVVARESDSDLFGAIENARYELRLHILQNAYWESTKAAFERKARPPRPDTPEKSYSSHGKLSTYLKTLKQILELRNLCANNEELKELITLDHKGMKVPWSRFFFDHENLHTFLKYYPKDQYTIPLAINGHIDRIEQPSTQRKYHTLKLVPPFVSPNAQNVIKKPQPQIVVTTPDLATHFNPGEEYIFFGIWKPSISYKKTEKYHWENQRIEMYIKNSEHFIRCEEN
ncbi:hypothetical protein M8R19_25835 [Pseudomonas sp. R3.Fl]|uniref:hypothetical protein n=1 Tax=Pseudomonas TaxID=286 RepID=UPI00078D4EAF|nr:MULTISPECIES: hypothetical protein [Pseudomonas]AMO77683.1 hypothetical protein PcP3B5_42840 [Pseudomonas citronellolis]MCL6692116.1 hypothetical protein [Pseudomonas sp. R3.Fl]MDN6875733.1 hypothetical protein [Pseudomonas citronellolis]OBP09161.1 hypothetical protein BAE52_20970 [Pseudomonas sp. EGD-AKN5]QOF85863.1 hypothetical protein IG194_03990 [Pseudomonas sp. ADPe]